MTTNQQTVIELGEAIVLDSGLEGWIYRPSQYSNTAFLLIKDSQIIETVNWRNFWNSGRVRFKPDSKYADLLGINIDTLTRFRSMRDEIICPFCSSRYTNRFDVRSIKQECPACQGTGVRAMYAESLVDAWIEGIRLSRDIEKAKYLCDVLVDGYHTLELRRTIRLIEKDSSTKEE